MYPLLTKSRLMKLVHVIVSTVPESVVEVEPYVLPYKESCPISLLHNAWIENEITSTIYTNIHIIYVHVYSENTSTQHEQY